MFDRSEELRQLTEHIQLVDMRFGELSAKAEAMESPENTPVFSLATWYEEEAEARQRRENDDGSEEPMRRVQISLRVELETERGRISVVPQARYHVPEEYAHLLSPPLLADYFNETAISVLVPFAREALYELSLKVFNARIVMPLFGPGDLTFTVD